MVSCFRRHFNVCLDEHFIPGRLQMVFRILCACALYGMFAVAQAQMTERERAQAISEVVALNEAMVEALARGDIP